MVGEAPAPRLGMMGPRAGTQSLLLIRIVISTEPVPRDSCRKPTPFLGKTAVGNQS